MSVSGVRGETSVGVEGSPAGPVMSGVCAGRVGMASGVCAGRVGMASGACA